MRLLIIDDMKYSVNINNNIVLKRVISILQYCEKSNYIIWVVDYYKIIFFCIQL